MEVENQPNLDKASELFNPQSLVNSPGPPTSDPLCALESRNNISLSQSTPDWGNYATSHRRIATSTPNDCVVCGESFLLDFHLIRHAKETGHKPYGCECNALFSRLNSLRRHLICFIHESPRYPCMYCTRPQGSTGFKRLDHLQRHIRDYHHIGLPTVKKIIDNTRFRTERALPVCSHLSCPQYRNEAFKQLPLESRVNNEPFPSQAAYSRHMRDKHDESAFPCDFPGCGRLGVRGFDTERDFLKHQQEVHSIMPPFPARKDQLHPTLQPPPEQQLQDHISAKSPMKENFTPASLESALSPVGQSLYPESVESQPPSVDFGSTPSTGTESSSLSCCSDTPESGIEDFLNITFQECRSPSSHSEATSIVSHGSNDKSSSITTPCGSLNSLANSSISNISSKRRRQSIDEEENPNDPNHPRKPKRSKRSGDAKRNEQQGRRLACPFHLFSPKKYCKNTPTRKLYETCSGPGWPKMHHLLQHLTDSASSIHKKRRCPRCLNPFTTNTAVVEHQKAHPEGCEQQRIQDSDEISDLTWNKIKSEVSKLGSFKRLPAPLRETIDLWVQNNLDSYAPNDTFENRQGELRKWYMTWQILFPSVDIPDHPFYPEDPDISPSNEELLLRSFKELLESGVDKGEVDGMTDENLLVIQDYLRTALRMANRARKESGSLGPNQHLPNPMPHLSFPSSASMSNVFTSSSQHTQGDMSGAHTQVHAPNASNILDAFTVDHTGTMTGYSVWGEASTSSTAISINQDAAWQMFEPQGQLPAPSIGNKLRTFTANRTATMSGCNIGAETSTSNASASATKDAEWDMFGTQIQLPAPNISNAPQNFKADHMDTMAGFNTGGEPWEQMFLEPEWDPDNPAEQHDYEQRVSDVS